MKVFQVTFDCTTITLIVEDESEIFDVLKKADGNFEMRGDDIAYKFDEGYSEGCRVKEVTKKRGVIQWESH